MVVPNKLYHDLLTCSMGSKVLWVRFLFSFRLEDTLGVHIIITLFLISFSYVWWLRRFVCSKTLSLKPGFSLFRRTVSSTFAAGNSPTVYQGFWSTGSFLSLLIASREVAPKRRIVRPNCPCFVSFQVGSLLFLLATPALPKRTNIVWMHFYRLNLFLELG